MRLPSFDTLHRLEEQGLIATRSLDDLVIFNYTQKCQWDGVWTEATKICRGLILRVDKPWPDSTKRLEVVGLPFAKFMNVGENGVFPKGRIMEAIDKLDGSLLVFFRHNGNFRVATRGSFDSVQAELGNELLKQYDLSWVPQNYTLLFELIHPENRIAIDYGNRKELVLIGCRDRFSGADFYGDTLRKLASFGGFGTPKIYDINSVEEAIAWAKTLNRNTEGCVLRFEDGSRWKVKGHAYRELFKLIHQVSPKMVLEKLALDEIFWFSAVPEEFYDDVNVWRKEYEKRMREVLERASMLVAQAPNGDRKERALWVRQNHPKDQDFIFGLLNGWNMPSLIYKKMLKGEI